MIRHEYDGEASTSDYVHHVREAASADAYRRNGNSDADLSAETLPENASLIDFRTFAKDFPDKLFPLLEMIRPEFKEIFIEYYLMGKPQAFIGQTHGFIQTRVWEALRIIEQTIGALIILGTHPSEELLRPILEKAKQEITPYGSFAAMIHLYAASQDYTLVAKTFGAPVPAIRKIFRPAIAALAASKDVKAVAIGSYLTNLTYRAALTKAGLSKSYQARVKRIKNRRFTAPPFENAPLLNFGPVDELADTPWCMLEISAEETMETLHPKIQEHGKKRFGKHAAQVFAPIDADGTLTFGYFFARSKVLSVVRSLVKIRGVVAISSAGDTAETFGHAVTIPHEDVQKMIADYKILPTLGIGQGDFVEILTGPASGYHGTVILVHQHTDTVHVEFPSGRHFIISADRSAIKRVDAPVQQRGFWGVIPESVGQKN